MAAPNGAAEHANKRIRLEDGASATTAISLDTPEPTMEKPKIAEISTNLSHSREREVGILNWVNEKNPGFEGILKQRYVVEDVVSSLKKIVVDGGGLQMTLERK